MTISVWSNRIQRRRWLQHVNPFLWSVISFRLLSPSLSPSLLSRYGNVFVFGDAMYVGMMVIPCRCFLVVKVLFFYLFKRNWIELKCWCYPDSDSSVSFSAIMRIYRTTMIEIEFSWKTKRNSTLYRIKHLLIF